MRYALCCLFAILILLSSFVAGPLLARGAERSATEGIERYKKLVKLHPHKATYRNALGYYYLKAGNLQEAEIRFLTAIEIDNSYPTPHNNLGVVYLKQDRPEQAEKEFLQAVSLNPQLDREYVNRRDNSEHTRKKLQSALEQAAEDEESSKELKRMQKWLAPNY